MMGNEIEILKVHLDSIGASIDKLDNSVSRLFVKQEEMNIVLVKNTVIMQQHHERSTKLESIQYDLNIAMTEALSTLSKVQLEVSRLDKDLQPIKQHVASIDKTFYFISGIPKSIKIITTIIIAITSVIGIYFSYIEVIVK